MDSSHPISLPGRGYSIWIRQGDAIVPQGNPYASNPGAETDSAAGGPALSSNPFTLWTNCSLSPNAIALTYSSPVEASASQANPFTLWTSGAGPTPNLIALTYAAGESAPGSEAISAPAVPPVSLPGDGFTLWTRPPTSKASSPVPAAPGATTGAKAAIPPEPQSSLLPAVLVAIVLVPLLLILGAFTSQKMSELSEARDRYKAIRIQNDNLTAAKGDLESKLEDSSKQLADTQNQVKALDGQLQQARSEATTKASDVQELSQQLAQQKAALQQANAAAAKLRADLEAKISALQRTGDAAAAEATSAKQALDVLKSESTQVANELQAAVSAARNEAKVLAAEKSELTQQLDAAKKSAVDLKGQIDALEKALEEAKEPADEGKSEEGKESPEA